MTFGHACRPPGRFRSWLSRRGRPEAPVWWCIECDRGWRQVYRDGAEFGVSGGYWEWVRA